MVANDWVCQYLANVLAVEVIRPSVMETTALGAAYLAGIQCGLYQGLAELSAQNPVQATFDTNMAAENRDIALKRWRAAVAATQLFTQQLNT